jgi:hypothetical protein
MQMGRDYAGGTLVALYKKYKQGSRERNVKHKWGQA